jgi:hypothetical protein
MEMLTFTTSLAGLGTAGLAVVVVAGGMAGVPAALPSGAVPALAACRRAFVYDGTATAGTGLKLALQKAAGTAGRAHRVTWLQREVRDAALCRELIADGHLCAARTRRARASAQPRGGLLKPIRRSVPRIPATTITNPAAESPAAARAITMTITGTTSSRLTHNLQALVWTFRRTCLVMFREIRRPEPVLSSQVIRLDLP